VPYEKQRRLHFTNFQDLICEACCISKWAVSCICRETKEGKEMDTKSMSLFLSHKTYTNSKNTEKTLRLPKICFMQN
jgi:hypothetical protein